MIVVVEGIDASGKTKLARLISHQCSLDFADRAALGQGPPKNHKEIIDRLERYLQEDMCIFDRHTAISQPIYGALREDPPLPDALIDAFYAKNPVIIYARCVQYGLKNHQINPKTDTVEHMQQLNEHYGALLQAYDRWAMKHALMWYTNYTQGAYIARAVQGILGR
jgi:hypothetical protein